MTSQRPLLHLSGYLLQGRSAPGGSGHLRHPLSSPEDLTGTRCALSEEWPSSGGEGHAWTVPDTVEIDRLSYIPVFWKRERCRVRFGGDDKHREPRCLLLTHLSHAGPPWPAASPPAHCRPRRRQTPGRGRAGTPRPRRHGEKRSEAWWPRRESSSKVMFMHINYTHSLNGECRAIGGKWHVAVRAAVNRR